MKKFFLFLTTVLWASILFAQSTESVHVWFEERSVPDDELTFFRDIERSGLDRYFYPTPVRGLTKFQIPKSWSCYTQFYEAWKYTGATLTFSGDAVSVNVICHAGFYLPTVNDTTKIYMGPCDSLSVDAAGTYNWQIDNMPVSEFFYLEFKADANNGSNTYLEKGKINRDRH